MQRFPIGKYLGANIFLWGFFLMLQGMKSIVFAATHLTDSLLAAAKNFTQLAVLRVISGAAEACRSVTLLLDISFIC